MQKIVQRSKIAHRRAADRVASKVDHLEKGKSWNRKREALRLRGYNHALIKTARAERTEQWERGALAPRRDVGEQAQTYGALPIFNFAMPDREKRSMPKWFSICEGDRVVVVNGREKGKIGEVEEVQREKAAVRVKGVNQADIAVPGWAKQSNAQSSVTTMGVGIPIEDVRLVYPLPDEETGIPRDVIIERLSCHNRKFNKVKGEWDQGIRAIPGTDTLIPWPEEIPPEHVDHDEDTLRQTVEEVTFAPTLLYPPMPTSVIDELRNKYSKFRTRHEWDYVQKKEEEAAKLDRRKELHTTMRTPLQELAEVRRKAKETGGSRELTEAQLAKIGEVMAGEAAKKVQIAKTLA